MEPLSKSVVKHQKAKSIFITDDEPSNNISQNLKTTKNNSQSANIIDYNNKNSPDINKSQRRVLLPNIRHFQSLSKAQQILNEIHKYMPDEKFFLFISDPKDKSKALSSRSHKKKNKQTSFTNNDKKEIINDFDYNVFDNEDKSVRNLMNQFKIKNQQKKLPKLERKKLVLNQLYGITPELNQKIAKVKNDKSLCLEDYQTKILTTLGAGGSVGNSELMDLLQNLNELKTDSESVQPLPPINLDIIYDHVLNNKAKPKYDKSRSIKEILSGKEEPKDEFEKEESMIKKIQRSNLKKGKVKRNAQLDVLPSYLKNLFKYT